MFLVLLGVYMFVAIRAKPYTKAQRKGFIRENGTACPFCSTVYEAQHNDGNIRPDAKKFDIHHLIPRANGGPSIPQNSAVICNVYCHNDLHDWIDMFRLDEAADFMFLTTVYIWFLAKKPSKDLKKRFHYYVYANSLKDLTDMFWEYLYSSSRETQALFYVYHRTKSETYYSHLLERPFHLDHMYATLVFAGLKKLGNQHREFFGRYRKYVECLDLQVA
tara:strand:+ start:140 stop:796 length:657 start_codon:yes stop_codon:yes gene_type:complete